MPAQVAPPNGPTDEPRPPAGSGEKGSAVAPAGALRVGLPRSPARHDGAEVWGSFWIDFQREFDAALDNVRR
jgi:hypothetical protein